MVSFSKIHQDFTPLDIFNLRQLFWGQRTLDVSSQVLVAVSVCLATIVLNLHYRKPSTHKMPTWVRRRQNQINRPWQRHSQYTKDAYLAKDNDKPSPQPLPYQHHPNQYRKHQHHHHNHHGTQVRAVLIQKMPGILLMRVPKQVQQNNSIHNSSRQRQVVFVLLLTKARDWSKSYPLVSFWQISDIKSTVYESKQW